MDKRTKREMNISAGHFQFEAFWFLCNAWVNERKIVAWKIQYLDFIFTLTLNVTYISK